MKYSKFQVTHYSEKSRRNQETCLEIFDVRVVSEEKLERIFLLLEVLDLTPRLYHVRQKLKIVF